jgi:hypothetical protein
MKDLFGREIQQKSTPARQRPVEIKEVVETAVSVAPAVATLPPPAGIIGRADEGFVCLDVTCQATAHDIVEDIDGWWRLECAFCGTGQWVRAKKSKATWSSGGETFRFRDGRFSGQTIAQVLEHARGADYLRWAAEKHPRQYVREQVKIALDAKGL